MEFMSIKDLINQYQYMDNLMSKLNKLIVDKQQKEALKLVKENELKVKRAYGNTDERLIIIDRYYDYIKRIVETSAVESFSRTDKYDLDYLKLREYNLRDFWMEMNRTEILKDDANNNFIIDYITMYPYKPLELL